MFPCYFIKNILINGNKREIEKKIFFFQLLCSTTFTNYSIILFNSTDHILFCNFFLLRFRLLDRSLLDRSFRRLRNRNLNGRTRCSRSCVIDSSFQSNFPSIYQVSRQDSGSLMLTIVRNVNAHGLTLIYEKSTITSKIQKVLHFHFPDEFIFFLDLLRKVKILDRTLLSDYLITDILIPQSKFIQIVEQMAIDHQIIS